METILLLAILYHVTPKPNKPATNDLQQADIRTEPTTRDFLWLCFCVAISIGTLIACLWPALDSLPPLFS